MVIRITLRRRTNLPIRVQAFIHRIIRGVIRLREYFFFEEMGLRV